MSGVYGLDYNAIIGVMQIFDFEDKQEILGGIRIMESTILSLVQKEKQ